MNSLIPPEISLLSSLSFLNLSNSLFSGQIPHELSGISKLALLDLSFNYLYGDFPIAIFNLPGLLVLNVSDNENLSGYLPEFNTTSPFRELDIADTEFSGTIPSTIGNLKSLNRLRLKNCYFSGSIPASIGQIPRSFSQLKNLEYLSLSENNFTGTVEVDIFFSSRNLAILSLSGCKITLNSPHHSNFSLPKLKSLSLARCNLTEFPYFLQFASELMALVLRGNNIHGNIPNWIWNASNLELIDLGANFLTGFERNLIAIQISKNCGALQSPPDDKQDDSEEDKFPSGYDWLFILLGLGSGLVVGFVMGDISMDRHPWLIRGIVRKFGQTQKKPRTRRRQIIRA
ncbi:hypothetical protein ACET3Z_020582 [Daucus carota]